MHMMVTRKGAVLGIALLLAPLPATAQEAAVLEQAFQRGYLQGLQAMRSVESGATKLEPGSPMALTEWRKAKARHASEMEKLEIERAREIAKARDELRRELTKDEKPGKREEQRAKYRMQLDKAQRKFAEKVAEADAKLREKRAELTND